MAHQFDDWKTRICDTRGYTVVWALILLIGISHNSYIRQEDIV